VIRSDRAKVALVSAGAALLLGIGVRAEQQQSAQSTTGQTASEHYKNIQVLKNIPADQLPNAMQYVAASLGVQCNFCHVQGQFASDDKPTKATARKMMQMVNSINSANYDITVSCATCHHGHMEPERTPPLATELTPGQAAREHPSESVDDVLAKYVQALGGRDAWSTATTVVMTGTQTSRDRRTSSVTIEEKVTGEYRIDVESPQGPASRVSDGQTTWFVIGDDIRPLEGLQAQQAARLADFGLPLHAREKYSDLAVQRYANLDGVNTIVLTGRTGPQVTEQLYFDRDTGYLVRRSIATRTPLGSLPEQIEYADYRDVSGLKLPFQVRYTTWREANSVTFSDVKVNVPLDDTIFRK